MPYSIIESPPLRWLVRLLALLCAAGAALLLWCGLGKSCPDFVSSCCSATLSSRWSSVFGLPVALPALLLHLTVIALTIPRLRDLAGARADHFLCAAGIAAIMAGVWFTALMIEMDSWCKVCLGVHIGGTLLGVLVVTGAVRAQKNGIRGPLAAGGWMALAATAVLIAVQMLAPHHIKVAEAPDLAGVSPAQQPGASAGRVVKFKSLDFDLTRLPREGPADAKGVLIKYFDYTCRSCRTMSEELNELRAKFPKDIAVVLMPLPLHRSCNPYLPPSLDDQVHQNACEMARWALAIHRAMPDKFHAYHEFLLKIPVPSGPAMVPQNLETAKKEAERLMPGVTTDREPAVEAQLKQNIEVYRMLIADGNIQMPKLLVPPDRVIHGLLPSKEATLTQLPKLLGITP